MGDDEKIVRGFVKELRDQVGRGRKRTSYSLLQAHGLADALDALLAGQAEESAVCPAWEPIETAPRDYSRVIVCWSDSDKLAPHVELGKFSPVAGWCNTYGHAFSCDPTHWFALPTPPKAEADHG